jgi:hypothetical protein
MTSEVWLANTDDEPEAWRTAFTVAKLCKAKHLPYRCSVRKAACGGYEVVAVPVVTEVQHA